MQRPRTRLLVLLAIAATGGGCGGASDDAHATSNAEPAGTRPRDEVLVVDRAMLSSITVETLAERDTTSTLSIAGKVQFDEDRVAHVLAPLAGQVVNLRVKVGDPVRRGQTLCEISSREAAAAIGERIESRKDLDLAEKDAAMTQDLFDHEAASKGALEQAPRER